MNTSGTSDFDSSQRDDETHFETLSKDPNSLTGRRMGQLRVLAPIASGGMATVYKALHTELEVIRALKVLKPGYTQDTRQRLQTEAKVAANLHHPNIVQIYNVGMWHNDLPFVEMEFVDGRSLHDIITDKKQVPFLVVMAIGAIVCRALDFACSQTFTVYGKQYHGLVHRDIKPANILISTAGMVKLTDFGIALPGSVSIHTSVPGVMGTFPYASPEQINCQPVDHRSDIYSLGTVLYEAISGERAFPQKTLPEVIQEKLKGKYEPIAGLAKDIPHEVGNCIDKSLMVDRDDRYQTHDEFARELEAIVAAYGTADPAAIVKKYVTENRITTVIPAAEQALARRKAWTAGFFVSALVLLALAGFGVIFWTFMQRHNSEKSIAVAPVDRAKDSLLLQKNEPVETISVLQPRNDSIASIARLPAPTAFENMNARLPVMQPGISATQLSSASETAHQPKTNGEAIKEKTGDSSEPDSIFMLKRFAALIEKKDGAGARVFVEAMPMADGFYHLLCGRYHLLKGDYTRAEKSLLLAQTTPTCMQGNILADALYYYALTQDRSYSIKPNIENKAKALKAWQHFPRGNCVKSATSSQRCLDASQKIARLSGM
jgi:serine/threonine protein kinase